jgi:hypothetical protein
MERAGRQAIRDQARLDRNLPFFRAFGVGFGMTPVALFEALFVAIFGQILVGLALGLSFYYLWIRRSLLLAGTALFGVILALGMILIITSWFGARLHLPLAYLLACSTGATIAYNFIIAGAIVQHYERATALVVAGSRAAGSSAIGSSTIGSSVISTHPAP